MTHPPAPLLPLALLLLSVTPAAAAELAGRPLLELDGYGRRVTVASIPFCEHTCRNINPRFASYRLQVLHDGRVSATFTENRLRNADSAASRVISGRGPRAAFDELRAALVAAPIGQIEDGCRAAILLPSADGDPAKFDAVHLSIQLQWYGAADRTRRLDLPVDAPFCPRPLERVVQAAVDYALAAAAPPKRSAVEAGDEGRPIE